MGCTGAPEKGTLYSTRVSLRISLIKNKIGKSLEWIYLYILYLMDILLLWVFILVLCQISKSICVTDISDFSYSPCLLNVSFPLYGELEKNDVFPCSHSES